MTLMGVPVVISGNIVVTAGKSNVILLDQSQLMVADDGSVTVDTSTEAALQMDSAPATPPTPLVSLWQQNMLGIRAERFIYWQMRRAGAVQMISGFPLGATFLEGFDSTGNPQDEQARLEAEQRERNERNEREQRERDQGAQPRR
jgi:hypothetical protein